jgi:hypothetical protein
MRENLGRLSLQFEIGLNCEICKRDIICKIYCKYNSISLLSFPYGNFMSDILSMCFPTYEELNLNMNDRRTILETFKDFVLKREIPPVNHGNKVKLTLIYWT